MEVPIRKFVINLAKSKDRRAYISSHFKELGIDFEFFDAVDGRGLSEGYIESVCDLKKAVKTWKPLTRGEIGCSLSHIGVYEKMIDESISEAIIFEDDVVVGSDFKKIIENRHAWMTKGADLILLGHRSPGMLRVQKTIPIDEIHSVGKMYFIAGGTHGYYITKRGAEKILKKNKPILKPIDDVTGDAVFGKHKLYAIFPPVAGFLLEEKSTIAGTPSVIPNSRSESLIIWLHPYFRKLMIDYDFPVMPFRCMQKIANRLLNRRKKGTTYGQISP